MARWLNFSGDRAGQWTVLSVRPPLRLFGIILPITHASTSSIGGSDSSSWGTDDHTCYCNYTPPKAAYGFVSDDVILCEVCYYIIQWILISPIHNAKEYILWYYHQFVPLKKEVTNRPYIQRIRKFYQRTWTIQYVEDGRQERGKYVMQLASSQLRTVLRGCVRVCHPFFLANCLLLHHEIFSSYYHW